MSEYAQKSRSSAAAAGHGAAGLRHSLNESAAVQHQLALGAALNRAVVQPKWLGEGPVRQWDKLLNGLQWFHDADSGEMWFERMQPGPQRQDEDALAGQRMSYQAWLGLGWGTRSEQYDKMVGDGRTRYERMLAMLEAGAGALPEESQQARNAFFDKRYTTSTQGDEYETDVNSVMKGRDDVSVREDYGVYRNTARLQEGHLTANHNYAMQGAAEEYDACACRRRCLVPLSRAE